ncbi:MAG: cupin domain-containing protein, partial [Desulforhopalus sp.]
MDKKYTKCHFDFDTLPWLTSPRHKLDLQGVALGLIHLPPDRGYTFTHTHRKQEEVYIIIKGGGLLLVDDEQLELLPGDMVRVSPWARRALKAHSNGLFAICCGGVPQGYPRNPNARYLIDDGIPDYRDIPPCYHGN